MGISSGGEKMWSVSVRSAALGVNASSSDELINNSDFVLCVETSGVSWDHWGVAASAIYDLGVA